MIHTTINMYKQISYGDDIAAELCLALYSFLEQIVLLKIERQLLFRRKEE